MNRTRRTMPRTQLDPTDAARIELATFSQEAAIAFVDFVRAADAHLDEPEDTNASSAVAAALDDFANIVAERRTALANHFPLTNKEATSDQAQ